MKPNYIFETSWEVCNKIGGIYAVLSTRAQSMVEFVGENNVIFVGPDVWKKSESIYFEPTVELDGFAEYVMERFGLQVRVGRWTVPGRPLAILVDFTPLYAQKDEIYGLMWELAMGILDAFGFNSMTERDFYKIVDKFYNYEEKYEIEPSFVKYLFQKAVEISYELEELLPYEYVCWESILLDIEAIKPDINIEKKELNQKDIDKLCLSSYVQNWFFDEITSDEFKEFIDKLSYQFKENMYNVDLDKFIADNFDSIFTTKELIYQQVSFNIAAYLRSLKDDLELAQIFYSLSTNYTFLTNILRKSIYEYYVGKRFILKNQRQIANKFEQKLTPNVGDFELLQLDMIISTIEAKWVDNA